MKDAYGEQLSQVVESPDLENDWENVLQLVHGRHLPAALPTDTVDSKLRAGLQLLSWAQ